MRILIIGGMQCGKTAAARQLASWLTIPCYHTDDIPRDDWSKVSEIIATDWLNKPSPWIIEGVRATHGLRKWLGAHKDGLPYDLLLQLWMPYDPLTPKQESTLRGFVSVWRSIAPEIAARQKTPA